MEYIPEFLGVHKIFMRPQKKKSNGVMTVLQGGQNWTAHALNHTKHSYIWGIPLISLEINVNHVDVQQIRVEYGNPKFWN